MKTFKYSVSLFFGTENVLYWKFINVFEIQYKVSYKQVSYKKYMYKGYAWLQFSQKKPYYAFVYNNKATFYIFWHICAIDG